MSNMALAVNQAVDEYRAYLSRMTMAAPKGLDAKRTTAWREYGFKDELDFNDFYKLVKRGGIAFGAVKKIIDRCWKTNPWIIEGDEEDASKDTTVWEAKVNEALKKVSFWQHFKEADRRRLCARYSALLLHVNDGGDWKHPVKRVKRLVKLTPVWQGALTPKEYDKDPLSETYGEPKVWYYSTSSPDGHIDQLEVHRDRVFILGDWSSEAIGFLEPSYNNFVSLEKVEGGSGESFLKNAARQLNINFDKEVNLEAIARAHDVPVNELQTIFDKVTREMNVGNDAAVITQGANVSPIVTAVSDPSPTYNVNLQSAAAGVDIPVKILVGQQTGERASTQDEEYFNSRCQSRRGDLAPEIEAFIHHCIKIRVLENTASFTCVWDDLTESKQKDKLDNAKLMAEINAFAIGTGTILFTDNQILTTAGFEPIEDGDTLGEGIDDHEEE